MTLNHTRAPIAVTPGDPAGIGIEIFLKSMEHAWTAPITVIANESLLKTRAAEIGLNYQKLREHFTVLSVPLAENSIAGEPNIKNAHYILECLKIATQGCLENKFSALVTGPVNKALINDAGTYFTGHTQYLAHLTETQQTVMMLMTSNLKVALLTDHIPLAQVPQSINEELIISTIKIIAQDLKKYFAIEDPRILICGLNPHAGENGHLGQEEIHIMIPTIKKLQAEGFHIKGPVPADTAFLPHQLKDCDVVLALYHDQGLPVLKFQGFGEAVNITLGLPIIRTSVDHGTAYELAGRGIADENSLKSAIKLAIDIVEKQHA